MNLIFFLFSCLFYEFAVRADVETTTEVIDTKELSECGQQLIKGIKEKNLRYGIKRTLLENKKLKGEIKKKDEVIAEKDEVIAEKDEVVKNSYHTYMSCAMSLIKITLEKGFPTKLHEKFTPIEGIVLKEYIDIPPPGDIYLLIMRDYQWVPKYNKYLSDISFHVYVKKVLYYKGVWLRYFCSKEGLELAYLIAPAHLGESKRKIVLMRFAYHMSRLFIISCACHHRLLDALKDQITTDPALTLQTHLRKLVPEWSCTLEQIKFFNKLLKHVYPACERLNVAKFGNATSIQVYDETYELIFVVPYDQKNCGFINDDELYPDADTKERKK